MSPGKPIAIAGASGFVGTSLRIALANKYQWIALTRSEARVSMEPDADNTTWRRCDLFSLPKVAEALKGAGKAIYMVHSMLPSNRLSQGSFRDMDMLLADNFIRGAEEAGIEHVIYLSGLVPRNVPESALSPHLASRLEVERILCSRSIPVTVLRTGVIFGPGGSSARMLINLVRRLPFMILPKWTRHRAQSIYIDDVVRIMEICLDSDDFHSHYDLAGYPPMTYGEMIQRTAKVLGHRTRGIHLPVNYLRLSRLWVRLFSGEPGYLVNPLIESLRHSLSVDPNPLLERISHNTISFEEGVACSVDKQGRPLPNPRQRTQQTDSQMIHKARRVRSVQRMPLPAGWNASHVTAEYTDWLQRSTLGVIRHDLAEDGTLSLYFLSKKWLLLRFEPTPYCRNLRRRRAYYITAGLLAKPADPPGRFEIRIFPDIHCLVAAVHGFAPRLPWWLYAVTQANVHLLVMRLFKWHLRKLRKSVAGNV